MGRIAASLFISRADYAPCERLCPKKNRT